MEKISHIKGQSLVEVIVAIGIAAIFLGAGVTAIAPIIRSNLETRTVEFADSLAQNYVDKLKNISESNWTTLYNLSKGSGNNYMLVASGTQTIVVQGEEASPDNDVTYGLIGHWNFDEATGTQAYDFSGNGNGGTLTNEPTRTASSSCAAGNCLSFDGSNNYISAGSGTSLNTYQAMTLVAWIKVPSATTHRVILARGRDTNYWNGYEMAIGSDHKLRITGETAGGTPVVTFDKKGSNVIDDNSWRHVVFTFDGTTGIIYINGIADVSTTGSFVSSDQINYIGRRLQGSYFLGLIDDVRVYNRALSATEIKQIYSNRIYSRSFMVDNVSRDSCGVGSITTDATSTCSSGPAVAGVADDPSTQKITVNVNWSGGGSRGSSISKVQYLARAVSSIFRQTNWSGGSGQEGPITAVNTQFTSSANIDNSGTEGSISISSGSSANLISSVFDTGVASGTAINSVMWQGSKPSGSSVKFQISSSNASGGPWSYFGPDGSDTTYYNPSDIGIPIQINLAYHNNQRYFRYKVFLDKTDQSPRVDDIIINWSK